MKLSNLKNHKKFSFSGLWNFIGQGSGQRFGHWSGQRSGKWIVGFLIVLLIVDLALLAFLTRKPLCLESTLIEEVEWVSYEGNKTSLYSCLVSNKKQVEKVFFEKIDDLQKRISQLENLLKTNFKPLYPIKIVIHSGSFSLLQFASDSVVISEELFFNSKWTFERAFLRSWLQQFQRGKGLGFFRLDVLSHFLMWNLGVQDLYDENWQSILKQWPSMASTWSGYCSSPVKDEAYALMCISPSFTKKAEYFMPLSLSYWFSYKLWQAFQALPMSQQMGFFNSLPSFIEEISQKEENQINEMTLKELELFTQNESEIWKQSLEKINYSSFGSTFLIKTKSELEESNIELGKVDLFIKKDNDWDSTELQSFQSLTFKELNYRLLVENPEGIWSFPWLAPINKKAIPSIHALNFIYITCEWPSVKTILDFQEHADKVIIVKSCADAPIRPIYSGLLHRGLQYFSLDNKDINFIYVNVEALRFLIKQDEKLSEMNLGSFSQANGRKNYLAEKANWVSALWNQRYRAYEVQATVDVIEWFKLPENTWPDFYLLQQ